MAYLGRQPLVGNYQVLDAIVATTTDTYALTKDAVAVFPQTPSNCIVSLNGVIQAPVGSYTISGSNIVFDSALTGTDSIDFITVLGDVLSIGTPTDGTVTTAKLVDSSVTTAKLNDGSVSLAKLTATGTKDATTFLRGDNTFAPVVSGLTEADQWRLTTTFAGDANPLSANLERVDASGWGKLGTGMTVSSGIWTFPSTGVWLIKFHIISYYDGQNRYATGQIHVTTDNSTYNSIASSEQGITNAGSNLYAHNLTETLVDVTDASNVKIKFVISCENDSTNIAGDTDSSFTHMMFIKLGDT
jgi:hypothetical protein